MKILLKDPALVDAVIEKVTRKYPCRQDMFLKYGVESIKRNVREDNPYILDVDFEFNGDTNNIVSKLGYIALSEIEIDTEYLNNK